MQPAMRGDDQKERPGGNCGALAPFPADMSTIAPAAVRRVFFVYQNVLGSGGGGATFVCWYVNIYNVNSML